MGSSWAAQTKPPTPSPAGHDLRVRISRGGPGRETSSLVTCWVWMVLVALPERSITLTLTEYEVTVQR